MIISWHLRNIKSISISLRVMIYYIQLSIRLIFTLTDYISCSNIKRSKLRNSYIFNVRFIILYLEKLFLS